MVKLSLVGEAPLETKHDDTFLTHQNANISCPSAVAAPDVLHQPAWKCFLSQ
jgi:hypothetical protein